MLALDVDSAVPAWRSPTPIAGAIPAFTTRRGGVSEGPYESLNLGRSTEDRPEAVDENRRRILTSLGLDPGRFANASQIHGPIVTRVTGPGLHPSCDGLITTIPGLTLAVAAADCVPILFAAPGVVAALHSGWRGTASGAPEAALAAVRNAVDPPPSEIHIFLGPCIRGCCYRVGPDVAAQFPAAAVGGTPDAPTLDLPTAVRLALIARGASADEIVDTGACTACDPGLYFSHRRDRGLTGRHWGLIALAA
jgi:YfiH family protein